jgi:hypothetical protein
MDDFHTFAFWGASSLSTSGVVSKLFATAVEGFIVGGVHGFTLRLCGQQPIPVPSDVENNDCPTTRDLHWVNARECLA